MPTKSNSPDSGANGQDEDASATALATPAAPSPALREVHNFLADIEDLVRSTTSLTGEDLARAKAKLGERVAAAKASLAKMTSAIADRARHTAETTDDYVHDRPWQAMGIAAAAGLLVGLYVSRRRA